MRTSIKAWMSSNFSQLLYVPLTKELAALEGPKNASVNSPLNTNNTKLIDNYKNWVKIHNYSHI